MTFYPGDGLALCCERGRHGGRQSDPRVPEPQRVHCAAGNLGPWPRSPAGPRGGRCPRRRAGHCLQARASWPRAVGQTGVVASWFVDRSPNCPRRPCIGPHGASIPAIMGSSCPLTGRSSHLQRRQNPISRGSGDNSGMRFAALGQAQFLKMVGMGCHEEHAFPGQLEVEHWMIHARGCDTNKRRQ